MALSPDSRIHFFPLRCSLSPDNLKQYLIVRWDTDMSFKVDVDILIAMKYLNRGLTTGESANLAKIPIAELLTTLKLLLDAGFIEFYDGEMLHPKVERIHPILKHVN